jgi:hypothetical protein
MWKKNGDLVAFEEGRVEFEAYGGTVVVRRASMVDQVAPPGTPHPPAGCLGLRRHRGLGPLGGDRIQSGRASAGYGVSRSHIA